jgi:hypothetical protein
VSNQQLLYLVLMAGVSFLCYVSGYMTGHMAGQRKILTLWNAWYKALQQRQKVRSLYAVPKENKDD